MTGFDEILRAAKNNDYKTMVALIAEDPEAARASNQIGQTGLHVAAIWGSMQAAIALLRAGADVNARNQFGLTPFHGAVQGDHYEFAKMLVELGANTKVRAKNGKMAIEVAKTDAMRILCGGQALEAHAAVIRSDASGLEALLTAGELDVSDQDSDGDTILHLAVQTAMGEPVGDAPLIEEVGLESRQGNPAILDLLLNFDSLNGFETAQRLHNDAGLMPLHIAAGGGDAPPNAAICAKLLRATKPAGLINAVSLRKGDLHNGQWGKKNSDGQIERLSAAGSTALHLAVQALADQAEDAEDRGEEVGDLDTSTVQLLLENGADANVADADLQTPLHIAIMGRMHEVVRLLCGAKADLSLGCKAFGKSNTALHQATILRDDEMIRLLVSHGANVDALGRDGWTPLCMAVRSNAVDTAKVLLDCNASLHAPAGNGKTPLEIASINGKAGVMELLQAVSLS